MWGASKTGRRSLQGKEGTMDFFPCRNMICIRRAQSKPVDKLLAYTRPISAFDGAETAYVYIFLDDDVIDSNMPVPEKKTVF